MKTELKNAFVFAAIVGGAIGCNYIGYVHGVDAGKLQAIGGEPEDWCPHEYHLDVQEEHGKMFYWVHDVESDVEILQGVEGIQSVEDAIIRTNL
jgi:hypothetical protein